MRSQTQTEPDSLTTVAFNRAIAEHADGLRAYAARLLGDSIQAEDVAQDAFLALFRHLHQVPTAAFRPWLYRVSRNLCLDQLRRRKFKMRLFRDLTGDDEKPQLPRDPNVHQPDEIAEARELGGNHVSRREQGQSGGIFYRKEFVDTCFRPAFQEVVVEAHDPEAGTSEKLYGFVPNIRRALSLNGDAMRAYTQLSGAVYHGGALTPAEREMIATVVSATNDCHY